MLRAFGRRIATCCDMLGVVGTILTIFKFKPTTPNMSQQIATRWSNACTMLRPTMLRYVAMACGDRLAGALEYIAGGHTSLQVSILDIGPFKSYFGQTHNLFIDLQPQC